VAFKKPRLEYSATALTVLVVGEVTTLIVMAIAVDITVEILALPLAYTNYLQILL
jgi:hypothetical protein